MSECPPGQCHRWRFEARPNGDIVLIEEAGAEDWLTAAAIPTPARRPTPTATPTPAPLSVAGQKKAFATSRAALTEYHPGRKPHDVVEALSDECAAWLSAGHSAGTLWGALDLLLRDWTKGVKVDSVDLNDDGLPDVVVEPQFPGLPVLACLAQEGEPYTCRSMPDTDVLAPGVDITQSGVLSQDLIGDGRAETVVTYTVPGASGWTELLYVFDWVETTSPDVVFRAALVNWAGRSTWQFERDPASPGRQQIVLTYPHLYTHGFDHKMVNHPLGRQVWRWDGDVSRRCSLWLAWLAFGGGSRRQGSCARCHRTAPPTCPATPGSALR